MKNLIREKYLLIRVRAKSLDKDKLILEQLFNDNNFKDAQLVLTYASMNDEVSTKELIVKCLELNKIVAVPKCINNTMNFHYIKSLADLQKGKFNLMEPTIINPVTNFENSICITPGVVFDQNGNRVGYGGGYYDRFFTKYDGYKIGICYDECLISKLPIDDHDIAVDMVITDKVKILTLKKQD